MMHKHLERLRKVGESRLLRLTVKPSRPNYGTEDPFVVLSGHPPPPGGTFYFPLSRRRSTALNGSFLMYPVVAPFSHPYTSSNTGSVSFPRGSGLASQSRTQSLQASSGRGAPTAPHAGSACEPVPRWSSAPPGRQPSVQAPGDRGHAGHRHVGGAWRLGSWGAGG